MRAPFLAVAIVVALCGTVSAQALPGSSQDPVAGARVFGSKGCSKCHAVNGIGGQVGPDLARIPRPRSYHDLTAAMWNHLPRMAAAMQRLDIPSPHLDSRSAADLVAFLFTLDYFDPPGSVEAGRSLFSSKGCITCHQIEGTGGVVGPNLDFFKQYGSPIWLAASMWNHGPAMSDAMRARGIPRPVFRGAELTDLIAYLQSASPEPARGILYVLPGRAEDGRRLFREKQCLKCHAVDGEGGRVGPDLVERKMPRSLTQFAAGMWNKAPAMLQAMKVAEVSVPQLGPDEMGAILAYLYSVRYFAHSGNAERGRAVAAEKGCLGCHGSRADSKAIALDQVRGVDLPGAVIAALWNHAAFAGDAGSAGKRWPQLSPAEVADLGAWLQRPVVTAR